MNFYNYYGEGFNLEQLKPRHTLLTHLSHDIGLHAETDPALPEGVRLGYDTLTVEI